MSSNERKIFIEKIITGTLIVALAFGVWNNKRKSMMQRLSSQRRQHDFDAFSAKKASMVLQHFASRKDVVSKDLSFRDPLKKPLEVTMIKEAEIVPVKVEESVPEPEPEEEDLFLEGIIWGGSKGLAIISGNVVSEGETVNSAKVLTITESSVTLERGTKQIILKR